MLISVTIGPEPCVALVRNTNVTHHQNNPTPLTDDVIIYKYSPPLPATPSSWKIFDDKVSSVDLQKVKATWLMYDKIYKCFGGLKFVDELNLPIAACKSKSPVEQLSSSVSSPLTLHGDLNFLVHFLGHQGTSTK
jgi:hypothetical protein